MAVKVHARHVISKNCLGRPVRFTGFSDRSTISSISTKYDIERVNKIENPRIFDLSLMVNVLSSTVFDEAKKGKKRLPGGNPYITYLVERSFQFLGLLSFEPPNISGFSVIAVHVVSNTVVGEFFDAIKVILFRSLFPFIKGFSRSKDLKGFIFRIPESHTTLAQSIEKMGFERDNVPSKSHVHVMKYLLEDE